MEAIKPIPKQYHEDAEWAYANIEEITKQYPDLYVGIFNKEVIAAAKTIAEVQEIALKKVNQKEIPIIFAEETIHVYQNKIIC